MGRKTRHGGDFITEADKYQLRGAPFQALLISAWMWRMVYYAPENRGVILTIIGLVGALLFAECLWTLYMKRARVNGLITSGVFRFTRHPMYTGIVLMDLECWFGKDLDLGFWISLVVLYSSIVIAGVIQEKETLARFGDKAKAYYSRTPRLFFMHPVLKWKMS